MSFSHPNVSIPQQSPQGHPFFLLQVPLLFPWVPTPRPQSAKRFASYFRLAFLFTPKVRPFFFVYMLTRMALVHSTIGKSLLLTALVSTFSLPHLPLRDQLLKPRLHVLDKVHFAEVFFFLSLFFPVSERNQKSLFLMVVLLPRFVLSGIFQFSRSCCSDRKPLLPPFKSRSPPPSMIPSLPLIQVRSIHPPNFSGATTHFFSLRNIPAPTFFFLQKSKPCPPVPHQHGIPPSSFEKPPPHFLPPPTRPLPPESGRKSFGASSALMKCFRGRFPTSLCPLLSDFVQTS